MSGIPRILHFVWIGGGDMPDWAQHNVQRFRELNPRYTVRIHDESALSQRYARVAASVTEPSSLADLIRYSVLQHEGGWYFDVDMYPMRPVRDVVSAYQLNGRRMFVTEQHGQKNEALKYNNAALAATPDCRAWDVVNRAIDELAPPHDRCAFGPMMFSRIVPASRRLFEVADWPWFYPAGVGKAGRLYRACLRGGDRYARRAAPTGNQLPFAMHLWASGERITMEDAESMGFLEGNPDGRYAGLRACMAVQQCQWGDETQPFRAIAAGLQRIGCDVVASDIQEDPTAEIETADLVVVWNGRKLWYKAAAEKAREAGVPLLVLEHGFLGDRRALTQADHAGILHWSSWSDRLTEPAPEGARERFEAVWPEPLRPFGRRNEGYVLVLGQCEHDSQMDDSELKESTTVERMVARTLPPDVEARFRPHPLSQARPKGARYMERCDTRTLKEAVEGARFVVCINSNAGNEALAWGCPVMCFGPALYLKAGVAKGTTCASLANDLNAMLDGWRPFDDEVANYLHWLAARQWSQDEWRQGDVLTRLLEEALP